MIFSKNLLPQSMSLLQKYNLANLSEKPLLILCEQTWGIDDKEYPRSALQGIEVAQYLRRVMKVKNPITQITSTTAEKK